MSCTPFRNYVGSALIRLDVSEAAGHGLVLPKGDIIHYLRFEIDSEIAYGGT